MRTAFPATVAALALAGSAAALQAAPPADWSAIPTTTLKLFYPGQSSYEWLHSEDHKRAFRRVAKGESCVSCHEDEEEEIGELIVSGERLEPTPVEGKNGSVDLAVQAAYDDRNLYLRFQWQTRNPYPGIAHPFLRFDGEQWSPYGYPKLDKVVQEGQQPGIYEDRLSMLIDDGKVPNFAEHGCWVTCHTGERDMPEQPSRAEVQANALFAALNKKDVRKFLPATRTDGLSWDKGKSLEAIAQIKAQGGFLDLMQWRGHRSNPVGMADDFHVLEYRNNDAGKGPFSSNEDKKNHQPRYMYDAAKMGANAIRTEDIRKGPVALIQEENAVAFDPDRDWQVGDLIPKYVVSRASAKGSAADNDDVKGEWNNGVWTVVWARKLGLTNPDDKTLEIGGVYDVGFAVHDDNITTRGHHVSFPVKVGIGAPATISAVKVP